MPGVDQNNKQVFPRIKGYQVKDFLCSVINRCAAPLDSTEITAVRIQAESELKQLAARERQARKDKYAGKKKKTERRRKVHIDYYENDFIQTDNEMDTQYASRLGNF